MNRIDLQASWTAQQHRAITHSHGDLFVCASAGTGKTEVLTCRSAALIAHADQPISALEILILTFTDAAAQQMKARVYQRIRQLVQTSAGDGRLAKQLLLIPAAQISTIHSFCKRLIEEHSFALGLDPGIRVIDQHEQSLLIADALEQTLAWAWKQDRIQQGLEALFRGRTARTIQDALLRMWDVLECVPDPESWYDLVLSAAADRLESRPLADVQTKQIYQELRNIVVLVSWLATNSGEKQPPIDPLQLLSAPASRSWQELGDALKAIGGWLKKNFKKDDPEPYACVAGFLLKRLSDLRELALLYPDYSQIIRSGYDLQVWTLIELAKALERFYNDLKTQAHGLDFADLERYALRLLAIKDGDRLIPSDIARQLQSRYKFILVDEYQDINPVQDAIIKLLHRGDNLFGVGDIKQCIYAFRGADPLIFRTYLDQAGAQGQVYLSVNFRSHKGILDLVNLIFSRIMRQQIAGIEYDRSAYLEPAGTWPDDPVVELHIIDPTGQDEDPSGQQRTKVYGGPRQRQAALVAGLIRRIVEDNGQQAVLVRDTQTGQLRPARFGDIVILLRSPSTSAIEYQKALQAAGIPVACDFADILDASDVKDCINILKVIDNPLRDIELAAVLTGPAVGISHSDLVRICHTGGAADAQPFLYDMVQVYAKSGPDRTLADRLGAFLSNLDRWRHLALVERLADLLWQIYLDTGLPWLALVQQDGSIRRANLIRFHRLCMEFDRLAGLDGSSPIERLIDYLEGVGGRWDVDVPEGQQQDAVRIMSIHKAKGLEFPIVILAEMQAPINLRDTKEDVLVDPEYGLGLTIVDEDRQVRLPSLEHQVIAARSQDRIIAEEMRLFYVAATRARDRLIMTGSMTRDECILLLELGRIGLNKGPSEQILDLLTRSKRNTLSWTIYACHDQSSLQKALGYQVDPAGKDLLVVYFYPGVSAAAALQESMQPRTRLLEPVDWTRIRSMLTWHYPFAGVSKCQAKWSVTSIAGLDQAYGHAGKVGWPDARLMGTAMHLVLATVPLVGTINQQVLDRTIDQLVADGRLSRDLAEAIPRWQILRFFEGPLGQQVLYQARSIWREWAFTVALDASEVANIQPCQELCILEGVVDMVVEVPDGALVIDFKTSSSRQMQALYTRQVQLYARAVEAILDVPVLAGWVYYLTDGQMVLVKPENARKEDY